MKIEKDDIVEVSQPHRKNGKLLYYGVVTGFYEYGLFVQPRNDMEPICFSWEANKIKVIKTKNDIQD